MALYIGTTIPNVIMKPWAVQVASFPSAPYVQIDPFGIGVVENAQAIDPMISKTLMGNSNRF